MENGDESFPAKTQVVALPHGKLQSCGFLRSDQNLQAKAHPTRDFHDPPKDLKVLREHPVTHMGYTGNTREK